MFANEIAVNQFQLGLFHKILADLPREKFFVPGAGHGHPPVWIMGHLALVAEFGHKMLGGDFLHPEWLPLFGPGSGNDVPRDFPLDQTDLGDVLVHSYLKLQEMASTANSQLTSLPTDIALFAGTPIITVGHCVTLLLTNHFGFHLAQLSSCRREAGLGPLF
ncbi:MAG: hypothetical protein SFX18_16235 [Pirellulales bacterium]|nr:hypothetical protein [Pirellulales bacterium]